MKPISSVNQQIINTLLLNASFINNIGLMNGKIGISIVFYHLARKYKNKIYEDYAGELIDEIYEEITSDTPIDFENGLAGIGWGIEYLVQNKFIEADTDEVLEEFDNRIFKELIYNTPPELGLLNGLLGIGAYFLKRIKNPESNDEKITTLTNKQTLIHLIDELERITLDVGEIIKEPSLIQPSDSPKGEVLRSTVPGKKSLSGYLGVKPVTFDITWTYPVLVWFLAELYKQNIFNSKVEKIIQKLIKPLTNNHIPKLQSNRLLLALTLTKLSQTIETIEITKISLLKDINRENIKTELPSNNATLKHGISGIAWVYQQLHHLAGNCHFKQEIEYWFNSFIVSDNIDEDALGMDFENLKAFGLLEGLAGILYISETSENLNKKSTI